MGKHAHFFESRRDTLTPHSSNAQGGPLCKRGGCVRTLRTPPAYGLAMLPLCIKAKFYAKPAFVLLKANFYAYYFCTKCPCESPAACAVYMTVTLRRNFMLIALMNGNILLIALMTGSYPHLSAPHMEDVRTKFRLIYTSSSLR